MTPHKQQYQHLYHPSPLSSSSLLGLPSPKRMFSRIKMDRIFSTVTTYVFVIIIALSLSLPSSISSSSSLFVSGQNALFTRTPIHLRAIVSDCGTYFAKKIANQYSFFRQDMKVEVVQYQSPRIVDPSTVSGVQQSYAAIQRGEADVAFLPYLPTPAEQAATPDLLYLPYWAVAGGPIYNLPTVTGELILSTTVLGRIFMGNITRSDA